MSDRPEPFPLARWALALALFGACSPEREPLARDEPAATAPAAPTRLRAAREPERATVHGLLHFGAAPDAPVPAERLGVLAEALQFGGPTALSGREFHQRIADAGARLDVRAAERALLFDLEAPPAALAELLEAAGRLARHPHYPPEVVALARERALAAADAASDDPSAVADARLAALAFGPSGPGAPPDLAALEETDREAVLALHRSLVAPEHLSAAARGPLEPERFAADLVRAFDGLAAAPEPDAAPARVPRPLDAVRAPRLTALVLGGAPRVELRLVAPGVPVTSPDYPALRIWSDLNGRRAGAGAFFAARWPEPGAGAASGELFGFVAEAASAADAFARLAELEAHLAGPAAQPAEPSAFEEARARVLASQAREAESPLALLAPGLFGAAEDFWEQHARALEAATPASVAAAAERALAPVRAGRWLATAVLPSAPTEAELAALRARGIEVELADGRSPLRGTPEAVARLERVLERLGGRDGWRRLEHLTLVGEVTLEGSGAPVAVTIVRDLARGLLRIEQRDQAGPRVQIATPERATTRAPGGEPTELDADLHARVLERERALVYAVLRGLARGTLHAVRLDGENGLVVTRMGVELCTLRLGGDLPLALELPATRHEPERVIAFEDWDPHGATGLLFAATMRDEGRRFRWLRIDPDRAPEASAFAIE